MTMSQYPLRPTSHIVGDDAVRVVQAACDPAWIVSSVGPDYGLDLRIELTRSSGHVTGEECYVQVKGSSHIELSTGQTPTVSVKRSSFNYWLGKLNPVLVALVDVSTETFWYGWLDRTIARPLPEEGPDTVRLGLLHHHPEVPLGLSLPEYLHAYLGGCVASSGVSPIADTFERILFHVTHLLRALASESTLLLQDVSDLDHERYVATHYSFVSTFVLHESALRLQWHQLVQRAPSGAANILRALESRFVAFEQVHPTFIESDAGTDRPTPAPSQAPDRDFADYMVKRGAALGYFRLRPEGLANLPSAIDALTEAQDILFQVLLLGNVRFASGVQS
jgi:hypothetical protein